MRKNRSFKHIIKKKIEIVNNQKKVIKNSGTRSARDAKKLKQEPKNIKLITTPTIKQNKVVNINSKSSMGDRFKQRLMQSSDLNKVSLVDKKIEFFNETYVKEEKVDYDVIIVVSSFNRYKKVIQLINTFFSQQTKYTFKIILLNDGSTDVNYKSLEHNEKIEYLENEINGGKMNYWKSITKLFKAASKYKAHCILQIDDDYVVCNNYLNILMDEFFKIKNITNKYVAISYHRTHENVPKQWGLIHWVDGGTLFDYRFIEYIKFRIDEINLTRWKRNKELSSGVWNQISYKINKLGGYVHKTPRSLVYHNGNYDSKMNKLQRDKSHIKTWGFKDGKKKR